MIFGIINFIFVCCLGVFFYNDLKKKEDDIEELYDMYYEINEWQQRANAKDSDMKGRVIKFDKRFF